MSQMTSSSTCFSLKMRTALIGSPMYLSPWNFDRLDEVAVADQEHGDDAREGAHSAAKFVRTRMPNAWLFSGWNCAPMMLPERIIEANGSP